MRLFTAIEIPQSVKDRLSGLLDRLCPAAKLSWTRIENLHITTKFIGEWPPGRLDELRQALAGVTVPGAIAIRMQGVDWFPDARRPKVLFAGVAPSANLSELAQATDAALTAIGVEKEDRAYAPHLTLARIRNRTPLDALRSAIDSFEPADLGSFQATAFYLYLSAAGKYTKLAEFGLV